MSPKSVFCLATSRTQAGQIVDRLKAASFSSHDISTLFSNHAASDEFAHVKHTKASQGAAAGAGAGGIIGGALGWIVGMGILAIPGADPFVAAHPFLAALGGAAMGAFLGGLSGGLIGMGIPKIEAKHHEGRLQDGSILISVHTENAAEITQAEVIFAYAGGQDICITDETAVSTDEGVTEIITYPNASALKRQVK